MPDDCTSEDVALICSKCKEVRMPGVCMGLFFPFPMKYWLAYAGPKSTGLCPTCRARLPRIEQLAFEAQEKEEQEYKAREKELSM